jgi:sugar lactone lactonase YvrE/murein DD-endopeptidase MepM/ murein hydrolase activator NlpD
VTLPPLQPSRKHWPARTRLTIAAALVLVLAMAALVWWRWFALTSEPPQLEPNWTAAVVTIAGTGTSGVEDGPSFAAQFTDPFGVAVRADGTIFVTDAGDRPRVRRIAPDGRVETFAGGERGFADGDGPAARFDTPSALAIDADGVLFVADTGNHAIRRISPDGRVTTLAGGGTPGDADGRGADARFNGPVGIALDRGNRVIVADTYNDRIRAIDHDGNVTTLAGGAGTGAGDGAAAGARFDTPCGVAVGAGGRIFVADTGNGTIRRIEASGDVSTIVAEVEGSSLRPLGIATDARGRIYVGDERGRIVEIPADAAARTVAGSLPGFHDGAGSEARFRRIGGIAVAGEGRLVVADAGNAIVRAVTARSRLTGLLPGSPLVHPTFDRGTFARTPLLWPVTPMEGPHEVAGTMGEARGADGAGRFHAGVDVRIDEGTPVRAIRDGTIVSPIAAYDFGTLNESLRIGPIAYVHVRAGRMRRGELVEHDGFVPGFDADGKLARVRVRRGTRFAAGDVIASVNQFNHVHVNVGWPGEEVNPLGLRLTGFQDSIPPTIGRRGIALYDELWQPIPQPRRGPPVLSGRIRIVVDAWDQSDGNRPNRRLGLYAFGYQVLTADGKPVAGFEQPRNTIEFDRLAPQPDAPGLVYAPAAASPSIAAAARDSSTS